MSRRIDIELTSALDDGSWTWRAAGARNPRGVVDGSVLPAGSKVGDELKVEVDQEIDGITILSVVHGRAKAERSLLELLPSEREFQPVVETRAPGGRRRDDDRRPRRDGDRPDRRPRGDGNQRGDGRGDARGPGRGAGSGPGDGRGSGRGEQRGDSARPGDSRGGERRPRRDGDRPRRGPSFTPPPEVPQRPKPQRLKPGKAHRNAVLADLPVEQRPIAELTLQGLAAVRQKVRDENEKAVAEGRPAMPEATVIKMAEELLPKLRVAEWRDRAEAAQAQMAQLDLRDLRSVVASANDPVVARDESTRALAAELTSALATKQEQELALWFGDVDAALAVGRVVRALRLSSQPPKAGVPFPTDIAQRLVDSANAALAPMDPPERWIAMLEAAAFSPVRAQIKPLRKPDAVNDDLLATVKRLGPALPQVAALFEIEVDPKATMPKPLRPGPRPGDKKDARGAKPDAKPDSKSEQKPKRDRKPEAASAASSEAATDDSSAAVTAPATPAAEPDTAEAADEPRTTEVVPDPVAEPGAQVAGDEPDPAPDAPAAAEPDAAEAADEPDTTEVAPDTAAEPDVAPAAEVAADEPDPAGTDSIETVGVDAAMAKLVESARSDAVLEAAAVITAETDVLDTAAEAIATTDEITNG